MIKEFTQSFLRRFNLQIVRYSKTDGYRTINLLEKHNIDTIIDCGANNGLYGKNLRKLGFEGQIISFEPIKSLYIELESKAKKDHLWSVNNYGLGDYNGSGNINITENYSSSSLLNILPSHINSEPRSRIISTEKIDIKKLSTVFNEFNLKGKSVYFKIDVQGYEGKVIDGTEDVIEHIKGLQVEMSLVPLYDNAPLLNDIISRLNEYDFQLMGLIPVFWDKHTQQMLQVDGIFYRI